jgi:translation initiation factor IF-2
MSDDKDDGNNNERPGGRTLGLRAGGQGRVRQNFSHGRSKTVVVETKRKRMIGPGAAKPATAETVAPPKPILPARETPAAPAPAAREPASAGQQSASPKVLRSLTAEEAEARERALAEARQRDIEDKKRAEIEAKERAEREAREAAERVELEAEEAKRAAKRAAEEEAKRKAEEAKAAKAEEPGDDAGAGRAKSRKPAGGGAKSPLHHQSRAPTWSAAVAS